MTSIKPLLLDGRSLTIRDVADVGRRRRRVGISPDAAHRVVRCRAMVDQLLEWNEKVYGLTTGFGKLRDVVIPPEKAKELQTNIIRSHACGVGKPFAEDVVRAAILLRANTLCLGHSGIRMETLEQLVGLLNDDVYPFVPQKGSVGASGDLAPLAHLALVVIGDPGGRYFPRARRSTNAVVVESRDEDFENLSADSAGLATLADREGWTWRPVTLEAKEGLALTNGTQFMTAVASLALWDLRRLLRGADAAMAMSFEALRGVRDAFHPLVHAARNLEGQGDIAARVLAYGEGSQILSLHLSSAHLQHACINLDESADHLKQMQQDIGSASVPPRMRTSALDDVLKIPPAHPVAVGDALQEVARVRRSLGEIIPRDSDGFLPDEIGNNWTQMDQREQIVFFENLLAPLRRAVTDLLCKVDDPSFPDIPSAHKVRSALLAAASQIKHAVPDTPLVQDDYSIRCHPQVAACAYRAVRHAEEIVAVEINSATDNPLLFPPEPDESVATLEEYRAWLQADPDRRRLCRERVLSGGNFHGQPVAAVMDYLAIAAAEIGSISERRTAHLVDDSLSRGLPPFLIESSGLHSGFMIPQYTAAALVSENKILAHPASVDSIPTCAGAEDHVSMGTIAARKAAEVIENVSVVAAVEMLTAYQALKFREPLAPGLPIRRIADFLADAGIRRYAEDRVMYPDILRVRDLMRDERFLNMLLPETVL